MDGRRRVSDALAAFSALLSPEGQRVSGLLGDYDEATALSVAQRLRSDGYEADLVASALTQARLRARARQKFGTFADRLFFTPDGLEQATRPAVAGRHAQRYSAAGCRHVADLCCGIGSDLAALASAGVAAFGVDRDPVTCEAAKANLSVLGLSSRTSVHCGDVASPDLDLTAVDGVFIDPGRRSSRGRTFDPRAYSPPYDVVLGLAQRVRATGAKLAPGIPHAVLPVDAEAEWVSDRGSVVECSLWFGPLATGVRRRATLLPGAATLTGNGLARGEVGPVRRYLYEPDGAVIRAGLVAEAAQLVDGRLVDSTIAYITSEEHVTTPFCSAYEVTDVLPFQLKRLRALLRARGVGHVTVKKRGSAIDPEALRRQLRLGGEAAATVVLTRVAGEPSALLVQPLPPPAVASQASTTTT